MSVPAGEAQSLRVSLAARSAHGDGPEPVARVLGPRDVLAASVWRALRGAVDDTPVGRLIVAAILDAGDEYAAQLIDQALRPQPVPGGLEAT